MVEKEWHTTRGLHAPAISDADERGRRATSTLLAATAGVREFGRVQTKQDRAPAGARSLGDFIRYRERPPRRATTWSAGGHGN